MGLELWEFLRRLDFVFGITMSVSEMTNLKSPSDVIDYVWTRLPRGMDSGCLSQKAFYRIRRLICQTLGIERRLITPNMFFADIVSSSVENDTLHKLLAKEFDAVGLPTFARRNKKRFFEEVTELVKHVLCIKPFSILNITELVQYLVAERPFMLKPKLDGWSRKEVGEVIKIRTILELGVKYRSEKDLFAEDLGVTG